ncbi:MAG: 3-deoxy-D-manno-octulosonic acid transferase [Bacteroidales bacterium]|jgi:3-deoxy-D-manno-octulosonic-acid transferase|nr:3-deoxy-D-manno-octulosonic acid transferase [Bacteroidales bacterium]
MIFFYSIFVRLYAFLATLISPFNNKARLWRSGRKNWQEKLKKHFPVDKKVVWFHCASLGEFEQGVPVMRRLKAENSELFLLVTFFSPSGYEIRKNNLIADYVCYMPVDVEKNARIFLQITNPKMAIFVKYDFWFHFLSKLTACNIPVFFISSLFRPDQYFFKFFGKWTWKYLQNITIFFVQDERSKTLLEHIGVKDVIVSGDTRFDRTLSLAERPQPLPLIERFKGSSLLIVGGSSWQPEEDILHDLSQCKSNNLKIVIAPHDVSKAHIQSIEKLFGRKCLRYSDANEQNIVSADILLIDSIGLLSRIYFYADIALIGGAFGSGLHNILEALTYGVPVFFGPKIEKFPEAQQAIEADCGFKIYNGGEFIGKIQHFLKEKNFLTELQQKSKTFIKTRTGATRIICERLKDFIN